MIGFSIAVPVGPIGVLCIRRTLAEGRLSGLISGLGAATADTFYGLISAFGFTLLADFLINSKDLLSLAGGAFLLYIGIKTLMSRPAAEAAQVTRRGRGLWGAYFSTLLLTLTNPLTILFFAAVIASAEIPTGGAGPLWVVVGVFLGSASWWLILSSGVSVIWSRLPDSGRSRLLLWANRLSGIVIILFAISVLIA